jgi:periplasmic divalent cation tolerance protein
VKVETQLGAAGRWIFCLIGADAMEKNTGMIVVYTTLPSESDARKIGQELVEEKLAACANIFPGMVAIYRWQGSVETENETAMLIKTRKDLLKQLFEALAAKHPYSVPTIVAFEPQDVAPPYLTWLFQQTMPEQ